MGTQASTLWLPMSNGIQQVGTLPLPYRGGVTRSITPTGSGRSRAKFSSELLWTSSVNCSGDLPPTLLNAQQQKDIKKTLKKYSAQFEVKDRLKMSKASKELVEKRRKLMQEYEDRRKLKQDEYIAQRSQRIELRNNVDTDETEGRGGELEEETVEFFIKEETTFIDE